MKVPLTWLNDYVDINGLSNKEISDELTMSGSKVEAIEELYADITNVVCGKIIEIQRHPDADKLQVCQVDIGNEKIQIVTGADNIKLNDTIPVALIGATLPNDIKISKGKLRGIPSCGMMCSISELNLTKDDYPDANENGIFILDNDATPGKCIKEHLGIKESVFEFEITPNRPDCLSILGMARETAATFKKEFKMPIVNVDYTGSKSSDKHVSVEIKDYEKCKRYSGIVVENIKIGSSPEWLRKKIKSAGIRPINNIVDITNFILLEYGQPMHAFDLDKLEGRKIIVRKANNGEVLKTLDDEIRKLDETMLVIADEKNPVAIAGVMGGLESGVTENTKTILFESANFDGASVRITSKKLGLRSESSARFEKGLDPNNTIPAVNRAAQLINMLGCGDVCEGVIDVKDFNKKNVEIEFRSERINRYLGTDIHENEMVDILRRIEFEVNLESRIIKIPGFRRDVEREADITEEVARFYGYNNIKPTLAAGNTASIGQRTRKQKLETLIRDTMISVGYSEASTYSFISPKTFDKLRLSKDSQLRNVVEITNPLGEDFSIMRTTTIAQMLESLSTNYNRRVEEAQLFEIGKVYINNENSELPEERLTLTAGVYGKVDFYDIKGVCEELLDVLGVKGYEFFVKSDNPIFHPGRTAEIIVKNNLIGTVGQIHPEVAKEYGCDYNTYILNMDIVKLIENSNTNREFIGLPKYPAVPRDLAFLIDDNILVKDIERVIKSRGGKILESLKLFDIYKGKQIPEGKKSVAYSIVFRAKEKTLTDGEISKTMNKIMNGLEFEFSATLR